MYMYHTFIMSKIILSVSLLLARANSAVVIRLVVCLSVCLCVCVSVLFVLNFWKPWFRDFICGTQVCFWNMWVKFVYYGYRVKVKVAEAEKMGCTSETKYTYTIFVFGLPSIKRYSCCQLFYNLSRLRFMLNAWLCAHYKFSYYFYYYYYHHHHYHY